MTQGKIPARSESDTLGPVEIPAGVYWGAQTQRALAHFAIGGIRFHPALVRAMTRVKLAAAGVNAAVGLLDGEQAGRIQQAAREVVAGSMADQFPLSVFISGSGTQFNMTPQPTRNRGRRSAGAAAGRGCGRPGASGSLGAT